MSNTDKKAEVRREAYRMGYLAGRRSCMDADNPYENNSRKARAWLMGFLDGRQRQLTVVRD